MSWNRLAYDDCRYARELNGNLDILKYVIHKERYENPNKCRHELGLLAGANVSLPRNNAIIDVESELFGITRVLSRCAVSQAKPLEDSPVILNDKTKPINTLDMKHLKPCQMIEYQEVPLPAPQALNRCRR